MSPANASTFLNQSFAVGDSELLHRLVSLRVYVAPIIAVVGIASNLIGIVVLLKIQASHGIYKLLLLAMLFADLFCLVVFSVTWLDAIGIRTYRNRGWCQAYSLAANASMFLRRWYTPCLSLDRILAWMMLKTNNCWSIDTRCKPLGRTLVIAVALISVMVYLNISLLYDNVDLEVDVACIPLFQYTLVIFLLQKLDMFFNEILPNIMLAIVIGYKMHAEKRIAIRINTDDSESLVRVSSCTKKVAMKIEQSMCTTCNPLFIVILVLNMPGFILKSFELIIGFEGKLSLSAVFMSLEICMFLTAISTIIKPLCLFISWPIFKQTLLALARCCKKCKSRSMTQDEYEMT